MLKLTSVLIFNIPSQQYEVEESRSAVGFRWVQTAAFTDIFGTFISSVGSVAMRTLSCKYKVVSVTWHCFKKKKSCGLNLGAQYELKRISGSK